MSTTSTDTVEEDQIRAVLADRAAAMRDRNAERFVARYAPQIVKFDLAPPLALTAPEARDAEGADRRDARSARLLHRADSAVTAVSRRTARRARH
jgi:hypothetical protein